MGKIFTGKLDDTGKEIYKGDKVRIEINTFSRTITQECEIIEKENIFYYKHEKGMLTTLNGLSYNCKLIKI